MMKILFKNSRIKLYLQVFYFFLLCGIAGCSGIKTSADASEENKLEDALLWKLTGPEIQEAYIFGTFHLLPEADFYLSKEVQEAFDQSEQVVMELDMDAPSLQMKMMQNMSMTDGSTLDQMLTKEEMELLDTQLQEAAGLSVAQVNSFKPFMVETLLLPTFIEGASASYEMSFVQRAIDQKKEILGLETIGFQAALFDKIPYTDQAEDLIELLKDRKQMEVLFRSMITLYQEEDINQLYSASVEYFSPDEVELLLHERNQNWIKNIPELAKEKPTFFAVGAGHLGGQEGIINLLKEAGYSLYPVLSESGKY
ncbi:MAG: TraB/GumN family protein [Bacteroidota bacterium]